MEVPANCPNECHVEKCSGKMAEPTWNSKHGIWITSCDGYVGVTSRGTPRPSHHQAAFLQGKWHTTTCLSKLLCSVQKPAKQDHKAADEIVANDQPAEPPARNADPEVKTIEDPTLLALVAPVPSTSAAGEAAPGPEKIPDERGDDPAKLPPIDSPSSHQTEGMVIHTPDVKKVKRGMAESLQHVLSTSAKKAKKDLPTGCGGKTSKAKECCLCHRPRDSEQRGSACPTCLRKMREHGVRSISKVLSQEDLLTKIRSESLAANPLPKAIAGEHVQRKISKVEKLLLEIQQGLGQ